MEAVSHTPVASVTVKTNSVTVELIPVISLLLLCIALVIYAGSVTDFSLTIADQLLQPAVYIRAVLGDGGIN
jgi:multicomponent K+:H+ antiporter subunit D